MLRLALAAGTVAAAILAYFISDTESAKNEFYTERAKSINTIQELRKEIAETKARINSLYNPFLELRALYVRSIQCADFAYRTQKKISFVIKNTYSKTNETSYQMTRLYNDAKAIMSQEEKNKLHLEIQELKKLKNILYEEQEKNKADRENFMNQVRIFNNETHTLKEFIRDNCGHGGQVWYNRIEAKKAMRHLS